MTLEKILRWVALTGIFAMPFIVLYVSSVLFFPFITGKNFAFRIITEITFGAWLALALVRAEYRPRRSWILAAFALFVAVIGIADVFGVNPDKSIWSNYERMDGWVTLAHLFAYFVTAISLLSTDRLWRKWWQTSLGVSVLVGSYGLLQLLGFVTINQGGVRLDATLGNATYLGVYMLFHVFLAALLWADEWVARTPGRRLNISLLYGSLIVLDSFILFYTATRGAILGLIAGSALSGLILILLAPRSRMAWRASVVIGVLIALGGAFWTFRDAAWVGKIEPLHRLASISVSDETTQARFRNWAVAWKGVEERPLLGWGQENFAVVFDKYYDPDMYASEPWFDRVHNILFDWLVAGGVIGLIAYIGILLAALDGIWRRMPGDGEAFVPHERALLTGLLAGYFFYNLFTFDNITSYTLFVSLLGFIAVRSNGRNAYVTERGLFSAHSLPVVAIIAVVLVWAIAWYVNASALAANRAIIAGLSAQPKGLLQNLEAFKTAIAYESYGTQEAREHLSQVASQLANPSVNATDEIRRTFFETAATEMAKQAEEDPFNARFPLFLGILLDSYGQYDIAKNWLARAHDVSPTKQSILFEIGTNALIRKDEDAAMTAFKQAYDLAPSYVEAQAHYVAVAIRLDQEAQVATLLQKMIEADTATSPRILAAYAERGRYDLIANVLSRHVEKQPTDAQGWYSMAAAFYKAGNTARALAALEELKTRMPSVAQDAQQLIHEIRAGTLKVD